MYLLDTNVVSELRRPRPNPEVVHWVEGLAEDQMFLSAVTMSATLIQDAMIAATAKVHGLTVATRNQRDFLALGIPSFNPFEHG